MPLPPLFEREAHMQHSEQADQQPVVTPVDPHSQPLQSVPLPPQDESDDPEQIFLRAVAEIDTQPLPKQARAFTLVEMLEIVLLVSVLCMSLGGILWQCLTYPHTLVVLFTKATPASIATTLDLPTRTVAPVTLTRSATTATTGTGHQDARAATGALLFYNGSSTPQSIPGGSVFTGNDGVKVTTEHSLTVPAANLPAIGSLPVQASALLPGSQGNIAAFDINLALSPVLKVRNEAPFTHGTDARTYRAVAAQDLQTVTTTVNGTLTRAFTTAFPLQPGEAALPTACQTTTTFTHQRGDEAPSVTLTISKTCSAVVYHTQQVESLATAALTRTKPAAAYHLVGNVQATVQSISPLTVTISGTWAYTFSPDYEQVLAEHIAGDSPAQARAYLLGTRVISSASIPGTLPPDAMYINFVVLVE
jgi:hypothetical protein